MDRHAAGFVHYQHVLVVFQYLDLVIVDGSFIANHIVSYMVHVFQSVVARDLFAIHSDYPGFYGVFVVSFRVRQKLVFGVLEKSFPQHSLLHISHEDVRVRLNIPQITHDLVLGQLLQI